MRTCFLCIFVLAACCCSQPAPAERPQPRMQPVASKPAPARSAPTTAPAAAPTPLVSIDAHDADLRDVVDSIARQAGVNIVCEPQIKETVNLTLRRVSYMDALQLVAEQTKCEINVLRGGVYYVIDPPKVTIQ